MASRWRFWRREEVQESQGPRVQRSKGPKDQDISISNSKNSLTQKKVHLVLKIVLIIAEHKYFLSNYIILYHVTCISYFHF